MRLILRTIAFAFAEMENKLVHVFGSGLYSEGNIPFSNRIITIDCVKFQNFEATVPEILSPTSSSPVKPALKPSAETKAF